ncbi:unnamed protein product, partial [Larinioides sclopetarius]
MDNFLDKTFEFVPLNESESMNFSAVNDSLYEDGIQFYYFYQMCRKINEFKCCQLKKEEKPSRKEENNGSIIL